MNFQDEGYIIKTQKYGESSLILTVLSKNHGKIVGFVKNCLHKKQLPVFQLGNKVSVDAYARLEENMYSFKIELISPMAAYFMSSMEKISVLGSLCELCNVCMMQNEKLENLYTLINGFFENINHENWLKYYAKFEISLLDFLGIGLDLSKCAVTGSSQNLKYISPKSGKAVSEIVGKNYADKLFAYPSFIFQQSSNTPKEELYDSLKMTAFFLKKNFFAVHDLKFPNNRDNLLRNFKL